MDDVQKAVRSPEAWQEDLVEEEVQEQLPEAVARRGHS
jgi:hypothetical protein